MSSIASSVRASPPVPEVLPEHLELLLEPPDADPEDESAAGELIHLRDLLRALEGVVHREHHDARAQGDAPGTRGQKRKHGEGLPVAFAPVRRVWTAGNEDIARLHLRREHHVRAEPQRIHLERLATLGDFDERIRGGVLATHDEGETVFHGEPLQGVGGGSWCVQTIARNTRVLTGRRLFRGTIPSSAVPGCLLQSMHAGQGTPAEHTGRPIPAEVPRPEAPSAEASQPGHPDPTIPPTGDSR